MRNLYIIRHAVAFDRDAAEWSDDRLRPLTPRGRRRWRRAAKGLVGLTPEIPVVLSSTWVRGWETAEILCETGGWPPPVACGALEVDDPEIAAEAVRLHLTDAAVAVVGHEPFLHRLVSYLLTDDPDRVNLTLRKGGCGLLAIPESGLPGSARLEWLLTPRALRVLAGNGG